MTGPAGYSARGPGGGERRARRGWRAAGLLAAAVLLASAAAPAQTATRTAYGVLRDGVFHVDREARAFRTIPLPGFAGVGRHGPEVDRSRFHPPYAPEAVARAALKDPARYVLVGRGDKPRAFRFSAVDYPLWVFAWAPDPERPGCRYFLADGYEPVHNNGADVTRLTARDIRLSPQEYGPSLGRLCGDGAEILIYGAVDAMFDDGAIPLPPRFPAPDRDVLQRLIEGYVDTLTTGFGGEAGLQRYLSEDVSHSYYHAGRLLAARLSDRGLHR